MKITPMEIQQQRFKKRLLGFESGQVEAFLERVADAMEDLVLERAGLIEQNATLKAEITGYKKREDAFRQSVIHSRQVIEGLKKNAEKEAGLVVAQAEVKAENILNKAHKRFAKISEDITDLKRQRARLDIRIRGVLAEHKKILDIHREENDAQDAREEKIAVFKKA